MTANLVDETNTVATFDDALLTSFNELSGKVATLTDLVKWFDENPKVLVGSAADIAGSTITVSLAYQSTKMIHNAYKYGIFEFNIRARVTSRAIDNPIIRGLSPLYSPADITHFDHTYEFELPFGTWPVATAMIAGNLLERQVEYGDSEKIRDLRESVDECLSVHFPRFDMEKLDDLHSAGLLPQNPNGDLDLRSFCLFLFQSRNESPAQALPAEFTP